MADDADLGKFLQALIDIGGTSSLMPRVDDIDPQRALTLAGLAERLGYVSGRLSRNAADEVYAVLDCTITPEGRSFLSNVQDAPAQSTDVSMFDRLKLSENLRRIVRRTAREFETTGTWASYDTLVYETAEGDGPYDINEIIGLPASIGGMWSNDERVSLTALGLILSEEAPECAHTMVQLVRICVERKLRLRDDASLSRAILVSEYAFPDERALRSLDLFQMLPGVSAGGQLGDNWELKIFRTALTDYRNVRTVHDLRAALEKQAIDRLELKNATFGAASEFVASSAFSQSFEPFALAHPVNVEQASDRIVFLSWSGSASRTVSAVIHGILQQRLPDCEVFFSPVSIDPGEDPMLEIFERNLLRAQTLVAILTEQASKSPWVTWEIATAWALKDLVVPIFVDVRPDDIPGPLPLKVQGMRLTDRAEVDRAVTAVMRQAGIETESALTDDEWMSLQDVTSGDEHASSFPARFSQRVVPLNDGRNPGTLLAILIEAEESLDACKCMLTSITGPPGIQTIPVPTILPWHPTNEAVIDVAAGSIELICIARVGPFPPSAVMDSTNHELPWVISNGAWRLELQLTARGRVAQLIDVAFKVTPSPGIPNQIIEWTELTVH